MTEKFATVIGIDLGTTNSCVGIWKNDRVEILANDEGCRVTPSVVSFTNDAILVGNPASRKKVQNLENTVYDTKRLLGKTFFDENVQQYIEYWPFKVLSSYSPNRNAAPIIEVISRGKLLRQRPADISAKVLRKMKETAELRVNTPITRAVITIPANFNQKQREETREAAELAGLEVMELMTEPSAAAYAYGFDSHKYNNYKVLVFDLGGGTFDVSVIEVVKGVFKVLAIKNDTNLGGRDFDNALFDYCNKKIKQRFCTDCSQEKKLQQKLLGKCEELKINLSNALEDSIYLGDLFPAIDEEIIVTHDIFQRVCRSLLNKAINITSETLNSAGLEPSDINEILLVGGASRIPAIHYRLREMFPGIKFNRAINEDEVVAYGAAVRAAQLCEITKKKAPKISLIEATPLSLGVSLRGGRFCPLIAKNSQVPIKVEMDICTVFNQQSSMILPIYEGERKLVQYNNFLGELNIEGLSKGVAQSAEVKVVFELDRNGILHARASHQKANGRSVRSSFDLDYNEKRTANKRSVEQMLNEAKRFKVQDQAEYERKTASYYLKIAIRKAEYEIAKSVPHDRAIMENQCQLYKYWAKQNRNATKEVFQKKLKAFEKATGIEFTGYGSDYYQDEDSD